LISLFFGVEGENSLEVFPGRFEIAVVGLDYPEILERDQVVLIEKQNAVEGFPGSGTVSAVVEAFSADDMTARVGRVPLDPQVADLERFVDTPHLAACVRQRDERVPLGGLTEPLEELIEVLRFQLFPGSTHDNHRFRNLSGTPDRSSFAGRRSKSPRARGDRADSTKAMARALLALLFSAD